MGKIKQGILGGFLGKVGSVVGGNFKGIATMRAMPLSVANPRTAAQVQNRTRFQLVNQLATEIGVSFLQVFWNRMAVKMSGYNLFCQTNKDVFNSSAEFQPAQLAISIGSILAPGINSSSADASDNTITIAYEYAIKGERLATDLGSVVVCNEVGNVILVQQDKPLTGAPWVISAAPDQLVPGANIYIYVTSKRLDGSKVGGTTYTSVTVAV